MKNWISSLRLLSGLGSCCLAFGVSAQTQPEAALAPTAPPAAVAEIAPPKLPYGVEDVVKLSKAKVNEDVIVKYIQNSGTIYTLTPKEIVYLRDQGVSDGVVHAMLDQRRNASEPAVQAQPQPVPEPSPAPVPAPAPTFAYPPPADAAPAQASTPASTVYVIPHPTTYSYYAYPGPYYYPYSGYYGGYWGPSFGFRFGYGGHGHYGHYGHYYHHH